MDTNINEKEGTIPALRGVSLKDTSGNIGRRKMKNRVFHGILLLAILFSLTMLGLLFSQVIGSGLEFLTVDFFRNYTSRFPAQAGIRAAIFGSLYTIGIAILFAFPVGVGGAIYLEEYADRGRIAGFIQVNINNLAGIPAIVYGILGLSVFVRFFGFDRSVLSAGLTLGSLIMPIIIVSAEEALKTVPRELKEASYALGATKWQTISGVILPYAFPGILTGAILAVSRGIGEASPLIVVGGAAGIWFTPKSVFDGFTTLPMQIYIWSGMPQADFKSVAASAILVLLAVLFSINLVAIVLRSKYQDRITR